MNWYKSFIKSGFDFSSRTSLKTFLKFLVLHTLLLGVVGFTFGVIEGVFELCGSTLTQDHFSKIAERLLFIYNVLIAIPSIALSVRRAHDLGLPGWIIVVPFLNLSIFLPGSKGVNKYGAPESC